MKNSANFIQTTHCGSLPRPDDVIDRAARRQAGETVDAAEYQARLAEATADVSPYTAVNVVAETAAVYADAVPSA